MNGTKATKAVTAPVTSADVACADVADLTALFADASGKSVPATLSAAVTLWETEDVLIVDFNYN